MKHFPKENSRKGRFHQKKKKRHKGKDGGKHVARIESSASFSPYKLKDQAAQRLMPGSAKRGI